jgi:hypothetical protein
VEEVQKDDRKARRERCGQLPPFFPVANRHPTVEIPSGIFGVPLAESIRYANVAISLTDEQGESFIYGYVPIVVAKCGVFLKEKGMYTLPLLPREVLIYL